MSIAGVTRELLVRYLDVWTPTALRARRSTFVYAGPDDPSVPEAALRVFAEFADRLRGRTLTLLAVAPRVDDLARRLTAVQAELGTPPDLNVQPAASGGTAEGHLPAVLSAAGAARAPLLAYVETADPPSARALKAVTGGRPAELLLATAPGAWAERRDALRAAGFTLTAGVELVDSDGTGDVRLIAFATSLDKNLEAFKNALWAVDEYAGVRFRDPADPDRHLLDISLKPHPGPLRRELLAHLADTGGCTVTDLRRYTLTDTVYRSADTTAAITSLLAAGTVTRDPPSGRLAGDVRISAPVR